MVDNTYKGIFKSTFLFSFVQIVRLLVGVIRNKIIAIFLGPSGMGMIGIYNTTLNFIKTGAGLGISQSAVRDISEANSIGDSRRFSEILSVTSKLVILTSLLGIVITIALSFLLSKWGFGTYRYYPSFVLLSIAVGFEIFVENQLAILKGMRQLTALAKSSIFGSIIALVIGVPVFIVFREKGIVPSIVISSFGSLIISNFYVRKIKFEYIKCSLSDVFRKGEPMIKMGVSLMMINFVSYLFDFVIIAFIRNTGGLEDVGYYNVGSTLVLSYFGIITTSLTTDYYPRIAAIHKDNKSISNEVQKQSNVGVILMMPLVVAFIIFTPFVIELLYNDKFILTSSYTDLAIFGVLISVVSNCLGYVLIAKQEAKIFLTITIFLRIVLLPIYMIFYYYMGIRGLGFSYAVNCFLQLIIYYFVVKSKYDIVLRKRTLINLAACIFSMIGAILLRQLYGNDLFYIFGIMWIVIVSSYAIHLMKVQMDIDLLKFIKDRYGKKI